MEQRFFCLRGFMKSGTNWLGGLLSTHHDITVVGEFHFEHVVTELDRMFRDNNIFHDVPELPGETRNRFDELVKSTIAQASGRQTKLIGERTPYSIEPVTLRGAPHISIIRDGRDVLVSRAFHLFNNPQTHRLFTRLPEMAKTWEHFKADPWFFQKNPDQLLCYEVMVRESGIAWDSQVMADQTVHERNPNLSVAYVRYEDLHADVHKERRRLFEFLDVDPDACDEIQGDFNPGFREERPDEFNRKGAVGDWKLYFTDDTKKWYGETAGAALEHLGYNDAE
jgi:hypothetical protein